MHSHLIALLVPGLLLPAGTPAGREPSAEKPTAFAGAHKLVRPTLLSVRKQSARLFAGSSGSA